MISFILPAHNEEALIGRTLDQLEIAIAEVVPGGRSACEVIVVDDASTDRTAEIARRKGAEVLSVNLRQIAAVRNAGAAVAKGDVFVFVDADTLLPGATLRAALGFLDSGGTAGGALVHMEGPVPVSATVVVWLWNIVSITRRWAAGCFIFVRREAFGALGGFDRRYFASEELVFSRGIKRFGRFTILRQCVTTSGRKARTVSMKSYFELMRRMAREGDSVLQKREGLDMWYNAPREPSPGSVPGSDRGSVPQA
ncbi:MAG: glycosyltransferase [Phycisphaeraceae bacterium]|nr:glycosyltransferase [Phycisphaeraceae bacterium]